MTHADDDAVVWVRSGLLPDGSYAATLELNNDRAVVLTRDTAATYAHAILHAVHVAEHDAAVLAQLAELGLDPDTAAAFIANDLRPARGPAPSTGQPLELVPGVSQRTRRGFLTVHIDGKPVGQWDLDDARTHALAVLETVVAAPLDAAYHATLTRTLGVDDDTARNVVADIERHRP